VARTARIPKSIDIFWRKEETSAMIIGDEKLDRRDSAKDRRTPHRQPERVPKGGPGNFIPIRRNPLKSPDSEK
jgi:hypothetical protein